MPKYKGVTIHLRDRNGGVQYDFCLNGKRNRGNCPDAKAAEEQAQAAIDRLTVGLAAKPPTTETFAKVTLKQAYEMVYERRWKGKRGERTAKCNALDCLKHLGENTAVEAVTTQMIDDMRETLKADGLSDATVRRKLAALTTILKHAATRGVIRGVPPIDRSGLKESQRTRFFTEDEEKTALEYLKFIGKQSMADLVTFLIDSGFRLSEALNMEWPQAEVDKSTGEVEWLRIFKNKGDYPRSVPTTLRVQDILKRRRAERPTNERRVFWDMTADSADWAWGLVRQHMNLTKEVDKEFVLHTCRHTFASRLAMRGASLMEIKELGGWKTLAMVMRYAHLCPDTKVKAIRRMEGRAEVSQPVMKIAAG